MSKAVWEQNELVNDPHQRADKAQKVQAMFSSIAGAYDLNNRLHSFGLDQAWRRAAVRIAKVGPRDDVVDIACGTGDLTELFAKSPARTVLGLDFTPPMLEHAMVFTKPTNMLTLGRNFRAQEVYEADIVRITPLDKLVNIKI